MTELGGATASQPTTDQPVADPLPADSPAMDPTAMDPPAVDQAMADLPAADQALAGDQDGEDLAEATDPGRRSSNLPGRLNALARLVQIGSVRSGPDGFDRELLADATDLLGRAGERLRLSGAHTVVTLAGGTGSGKSSLFNTLAGADFSPVGVTRPMTSEPHACVWGMAGAGPLLDWLGIQRRHRYARASALDQGEENLNGLLLIDLPDHDSVTANASHEVDRMVGLADLMIWVLDPQKYADAAVHTRYLTRLAAHSSVITILLNQVDLLSPQQSEDCLTDLRRLLDSEGLQDVRVLLTSAVAGTGTDELRKVLTETVTARRAAGERIEADMDILAGRFEAYARDGAATVPEPAAATLTDAFAHAAGMVAAGEALQGARELQAGEYIGWPIATLATRLRGRNRVRKTGLGNLASQLRSLAAGTADAQPAEIDNALTAFGAEAGPRLPTPWSHTVYSAARTRADAIPGALGAAIVESLPADGGVPAWWRVVRACQWGLIAAAIAGLAWMGAILAFAEFHVDRQVSSPLLDQITLLPWVAAVIVATLLLGWLTSSGCMNMVMLAADRERSRAEQGMRSRIAKVAREFVLIPVEQELSEYDRYRDELKAAHPHP
ncbi:MAG TPA: ABC transporter [Streptosporangiaceae bacterium]|jgi:GTP-binding protein EngB required for normal cell division|nr:ABC transporter [Streptosporangiaceae bacterium]